MIKPLVALVALVGAFYVSVTYQYGDPGWQLEFKTRPASAQTDTTPADYDLKSLQVLNRAVIHIKENYVDPSRINERKMIAAAMEEVTRSVPEVLVEAENDKEGRPRRLTVRVDQAEQTFDLGDVDNLWQMSFKFKDVFRFVQENLKHFDRFQEIEYAAINGMLSTLDPHSVLMRPEDYREMKLSTRGKFGGLGIVIAVKDSHLTVVNPIEDTPASKAGIKAGDRIVQINQDSTVNLALQDAVNMLRGAPNTKVDIHIIRDGWKAPKKFTLTRANIRVASVDHKLLPDRVGVVRIKNFQNTTDEELGEALDDLKKKASGLKGLVLDLRNNPGGLLDQAIKIADRFIESGDIVTTVGYGDKLREPKVAMRAGTEEPYPLVVLVDRNSASASEIVAGALKNHKRALVVGDQTFGKGSVQVIYDNKDDSALKLTIAQYLTPGDISIQSVGIVPDIATTPVVLTDEETDFFRSDEDKGGEKNLKAHLDHESSEISKRVTAEITLKYLQDAALEKQIEENPNDLIVDFDISLARDIVAATDKPQRDAMLAEVRTVIERRAAEERGRIQAALATRGVDWSPVAAAPTGKGQAELTLTATPAEGRVTAGEEVALRATVRNTGSAPLRLVRGLTRSDNDLFDTYELLFGNIPPGEARTWPVKMKTPKSALSRRDPVRVELFDADGPLAATGNLTVGITQLARPRFALAFTVDDRQGGNGDGLLQRGEDVEFLLDVQNVGDGKSFTTVATLNNPEDDETRPVFIKRGRVTLDNMAPGERKQARFAVKVKDELFKPDLQINLVVADTDIRESTSEVFTLRVTGPEDVFQAGRTRLVPKAAGELVLRGLNAADAPQVSVSAGPIRADGRLGDWYRVPTGDRLFAWVPADEVEATPEAPGMAYASLRPAPLQGPPVITLVDGPGHASVKGGALTLSGEALGGRLIQDLFIYVSSKNRSNTKVFFKSNSDAKIAGDKQRLRFSARVPLEAGVNRITVVAREDEELSSRQTLFVHREN
ncbi:S41 family peptidase [Myxococcota bacterium]|nr:S41 family peptidase [Myxococcota bacterium]